MRRRLRVGLTIVGAIAVAYVAGLSAFGWFIEAYTLKGSRYLIPDGYKGWLCVSYEVAGAPTFPKEDGYSLVKFDDRGEVQTADHGISGDAKDEFWWVTTHGLVRLNLATERGGGFTTANRETPSRYTFMFWVSKDAKLEQPSYSPNNPAKCGPQ